MLGRMKVKVRYGAQRARLSLYVVEGHGPSLMGRDWLAHIRLEWKSIGLASLTSGHRSVEALLEQYSEVFAEDSGPMNTFEARLTLKSDASPQFHKARPVPFALKPAIERELDRLEREGVIQKVTHSSWAAPLVPVPKGDGHLRLCGDYKVSINPYLEVDQYPLPKPTELFATLAGGKIFTKIDLSHAYQQMNLEKSSRELVTVNTHRGLYQFVRLPFGIASAPAVFQKTMDTVLQGLPKVLCYLDDILITGSNEEEHFQNVEQVLQRLQQYGIRAKRSKCTFMSESVEYLGHRVDASGLHTAASKVEAVRRAPQPCNVQELRSFLGLLHYYGRFLPNLATLLQPLQNLLKADQQWEWTQTCSEAFEAAKKLLVEAPVLAHYDPALPIKMAGDASSYGVGAVISHVFADGSERPVAFASRTLSASEKNYSQLEKEALSLVYGVQKFHQFLYGRHFVLLTDHKPLLTLLGPKNGIPPLAAARLQRWALLLSAYHYEIQFKPTGAHANADGLSRLPMGLHDPKPDSKRVSAERAFLVGQVQALPVTAERLATATRKDPILSKVYLYVREGWPNEVPEELRPYERRKDELSLEGGCILWGIRAVIPMKLQAVMTEELHRDHPGVVRMKSVARSYLWWPHLDRALEECARACASCQAVKSAPPQAPLHPWLWPDRPWKRVHLDFAGPFKGSMFLVAIDAHSKWPEVVQMASTTSQKTIGALKAMFAAYGLPEQIVTDNGPQFVAEEFAVFMRSNGIKHIRSAPYHPATNGAVERFVQTLKRALRAQDGSASPLCEQLSSFLLTYRATPHATTNESPSQLFLGRQIRIRLDLLRPDPGKRVDLRQAQQKAYHDTRVRVRELDVGQSVMARNFRHGMPWTPAVVVRRLGPVSYLVRLSTGQLWRRHVDHLRSCDILPTGSDVPLGVESDWSVVSDSPLVTTRAEGSTSTSSSSRSSPAPGSRRYPQREHHAPDRYTPERY